MPTGNTPRSSGAQKQDQIKRACGSVGRELNTPGYAIRAIVPVITRRPATLVHAEQVASSSALVGVAVTACLTSLVRIEFIHQHGWTRFLNTTLGTNDVEQVGASELNIFVFAKLIETTQVNARHNSWPPVHCNGLGSA